jgi:hypothetical protein
LHYPAGLYSLSHVALPFPTSDALYGLTPDPTEDFGIQSAPWRRAGSETCWLPAWTHCFVSPPTRSSPYMIARIGEGIAGRPVGATDATAASAPPRGRDVDDEAPGWSFKNVVTTILDFIESRPDPTPEPP